MDFNDLPTGSLYPNIAKLAADLGRIAESGIGSSDQTIPEILTLIEEAIKELNSIPHEIWQSEDPSRLIQAIITTIKALLAE
ncbi:MAG: hypothetical protein JNK26_03650, partial [Candidatus Doudnabacteria bacterium]|nr:hypothetical protein [Candidatus Doudnabacteria bacterium]